MRIMALAAAALAASALGGAASATPFTRTSPGGALPAGVTEIGGLVLDLTGSNGVRVVSQLAASSLYVGFAGFNPQTIGVQAGFTPAVLGALGGGLNAASVRVTLFDGDSAPFDFDDGNNTLLVNGVSFGNFSGVATQQTSSDGLALLGNGLGFGDDILSTGFFSAAPLDLAALFATLGGGTVTFAVNDTDPGDNFYDFAQGVNGGLINVGTGPVVQPPVNVPEPGALLMFGAGLLGLASFRRRF